MTSESGADGWQRLWTPHRMAYVTGSDRPAGGYEEPAGCPFCQAPALPESGNLVVARGERVYAVLNLYPYNPGHLMVCPYRHVPDYTDLTTDEVAELGRFTQVAMTAMRAVAGPHGFNIGLNLGKVILRLLDDPAFSTAAKHFGQAHGHFRRYAALPVHQFR